jgi:hypothetical protein
MDVQKLTCYQPFSPFPDAIHMGLYRLFPLKCYNNFKVFRILEKFKLPMPIPIRRNAFAGHLPM